MIRAFVAILGASGCAPPPPRGCGTATGTAATTSSPMLDPLVQAYTQSNGTWTGEIACTSIQPFELSFKHDPVPAESLVVRERALESAQDGLVCPAAEAEVEVDVASEHFMYSGTAHLTLAPEGDTELVRVYVNDVETTLSVLFYLDGSSEGRMVLDSLNETCTGPLVRL